MNKKYGDSYKYSGCGISSFGTYNGKIWSQDGWYFIANQFGLLDLEQGPHVPVIWGKWVEWRICPCSRGRKLGSHKRNLAHTPLQSPSRGRFYTRGAPVPNTNTYLGNLLANC